MKLTVKYSTNRYLKKVMPSVAHGTCIKFDNKKNVLLYRRSCFQPKFLIILALIIITIVIIRTIISQSKNHDQYAVSWFTCISEKDVTVALCFWNNTNQQGQGYEDSAYLQTLHGANLKVSQEPLLSGVLSFVTTTTNRCGKTVAGRVF